MTMFENDTMLILYISPPAIGKMWLLHSVHSICAALAFQRREKYMYESSINSSILLTGILGIIRRKI